MSTTYSPVRVPLVTNLNIEEFNGASVTKFSSFMKNAVAERVGPEPDTKMYARHRPALSVLTSNGTAKTAGRGIFFWDTNSTLYYVNDDTIYRGAYTSVGTISSGTQRCYFSQVGTKLFITDPENNEAWTVTTSHTLAQVSDGDFPSTLAHGHTTLNGYAFVLDEDGVIYNSDVDDPTAWNPLNFTEAERQPDGGVFLGTHHDHIIVGGPRTIEFFYFDSTNASGSPLTRRSDVFYNIGMLSGESVWQFGDVIYFLGTEAKGSLNVYKLEGFQISRVSDYGMNTYLTNLIYREAKGVLFSGFQAQGKSFLLVTPYDTAIPSYSDGYYTFAYCPEDDLWYWFTTGLSAVGSSTALEIVDWTLRTGLSATIGRGITASGTIVSIYDVLGAQDIDTGAYVFPGYWVAGYAEGDSGGDTQAIPVCLRTGTQDGGTNLWKFCRALELAGDRTSSSATATVTWSDDTALDADYTGGGRTLDLSTKQKLTRCGRFIRRSFQVDYSDTLPIRLEAIEVSAAIGNK